MMILTMKTYQPSLNRSWLENGKGYSVQKIPGDHSAREGHHHIIKVPIAGEGVDRSEIEKSVINLSLNLV